MVNQAASVGPVAGESWADTYQRLWPSLARALTAATGAFEGVEDALQDAFVLAMRRDPGSYRSVEGWVFVVALNAFRRARRREAVLRRLRLRSAQQDTLSQSLARADIARALAKLGSRERELLVAKYYVGLTQEEIARAFGLRRSAAAMAISRAAEHFRSLEEPQ